MNRTRHAVKFLCTSLLILLLLQPWLSLSAMAASPLASGQASPAAQDLPGWVQAVTVERQAFELLDSEPEAAAARYAEAAALFEAVGEASEGDGLPYWRAARCRWFIGEMFPVEEKKQRVEQFELTQDLARRGMETDPDCAECMLWNFVGMGRIATSRSLVYGIRRASLMADLLERGIALEPTYRDGDDNSTLGNLHYSSAIFYRVLPDSIWLRWMLGVRGDKERALEHARTALSLHPARLDFRVEVASQLLCLGSTDEQSERLEEGRRILEGLLDTETKSVRDERQITAAKVMIESPVKSCGYTGDAWVEIDAQAAAAAAEPEGDEGG